MCPAPQRSAPNPARSPPDDHKPKPRRSRAARRRRPRTPREPHRTTATYRERIRGYPSVLYIYQHRASPFWWGHWERGCTYRCSTRTEDRVTSIAFAKQYFSDIKQRIRSGSAGVRSPSGYNGCSRSRVRLSTFHPGYTDRALTCSDRGPVDDRGLTPARRPVPLTDRRQDPLIGHRQDPLTGHRRDPLSRNRLVP
jgi:hypothetical protein